MFNSASHDRCRRDDPDATTAVEQEQLAVAPIDSLKQGREGCANERDVIGEALLNKETFRQLDSLIAS
jgi:hypothetical protein